MNIYLLALERYNNLEAISWFPLFYAFVKDLAKDSIINSNYQYVKYLL